MAVNRSVLRVLVVLMAVALLAFLVGACKGGGDERALQDLQALAGEAVEGITTKVTYRVMTEVEGETFEGEWVLAQRPPDSRFEISGLGAGGPFFRSISITIGGDSYLCYAGGGTESCLAARGEEAEAETASFDPIFDIPLQLAEEAAQADLIETSQRQIAGVDATCFTVAGGAGDIREGEVCFSDDGLPLLLRTDSDGDSFLIEATSVSTEVSDVEFAPPYTIIEVPEIDIPSP